MNCLESQSLFVHILCVFDRIMDRSNNERKQTSKQINIRGNINSDETITNESEETISIEEWISYKNSPPFESLSNKHYKNVQFFTQIQPFFFHSLTFRSAFPTQYHQSAAACMPTRWRF